jgi:hypothetical protein
MVRTFWVLTLSYLQGLFTLTSVPCPIVLLLAIPDACVCVVYTVSFPVLASGFPSGISLRYTFPSGSNLVCKLGQRHRLIVRQISFLSTSRYVFTAISKAFVVDGSLVDYCRKGFSTYFWRIYTRKNLGSVSGLMTGIAFNSQ